MSPELEQAIKERVDLGHSKEQIAIELQAAGYDDVTIESVYGAVVGGAVSAVPPATTNLPSALSMLSAAWKGMCSRLDLVAIITVPYVLLAVAQVAPVFVNVPNTPAFFVAAVVGGIVGLIVMILLQMSVIHNIVESHKQGSAVAFADSVTWIKANFWAFLWVGILTAAVALGGFMLFLIPGIIISISLAVAQYVYIDEGVRGMDALQRSRALVSGRWWATVWRFMVFGFFVFLAYIPVFVVVGGATALMPERTAEAVAILIESLISGFVAVLGMYFGVQMFRVLRSTQTLRVAPSKAYPVLAILGGLVFALIVAAAITGATMVGELPEDEYNNPWSDMASEQPELTDFEAEQLELSSQDQAELEAFMQEFEADFEMN